MSIWTVWVILIDLANNPEPIKKALHFCKAFAPPLGLCKENPTALQP